MQLNDPTQVIRPGGPGSQISLVNRSFNNGAFQEVSGFDLSVAYRFDLWGGRASISNTATYYDTFDFAPIALDANNNPVTGNPIDGTGNVTLGDFPQLRDNFGVGFTRGNHSINATARLPQRSAQYPCKYLDGFGRYAIIHHTGYFRIPIWWVMTANSKLVVLTVTDRDPVFDPNANEEAGYFKSTDDPRGAVVFARWTQQF